MNFAPLWVLMNARSPEEANAVGQALLFGNLPAMNRTQLQTLSALSAQQSAVALKAQIDKSYQQGRRDLEAELIEEFQALASDSQYQADDSSALSRIRKKIIHWWEENEAQIIQSMNAQSADADREIARIHADLGAFLGTSTLDSEASTPLSNDDSGAPKSSEHTALYAEAESQLVQEFVAVLELQRNTPKRAYLSEQQLESCPLLLKKLCQNMLVEAVVGNH